MWVGWCVEVRVGFGMVHECLCVCVCVCVRVCVCACESVSYANRRDIEVQ